MYNVIKDPLFRVAMLDGTERMCGIRDILLMAPNIRGICAGALELVAMLRLLEALIMDSMPISNQSARAKLLESERFEMEVFDAYIEECDRAGPRFELFDPVHPFMQAAYNADTDANSLKSIAQLMFDVPSGNSHIFFDHNGQDGRSLSPGEAFLSLCALYLFSTAGAQGYPSSVNMAPPLYAIINGKNLFETLVLNCLSQREYSRVGYGCGKVPWRSNNDIIPKAQYIEMTLMEAFTWQPRRATLRLNEQTGRVDSVNLQQGKNFIGNALWRDPHVPRRALKKGEYANVCPKQGRELWRDAGTIVSVDPNIAPPSISYLRDISGDDSMPIIDVTLIGAITSKAAILGVVSEQLSMPAAVLNDALLPYRLRDDLEFIENLQSWILYITGKELCKDTATRAQEAFLKGAHELIFGEYLELLSDASIDIEQRYIKARSLIDQVVKDILFNVINTVIALDGNDERALRTQVAVRGAIIGRWYQLVKEREK